MRILFVENDPEMSQVYQESFIQPEFETVVATNGMDALKMLRNETRPVDVMVTEIFTSEMDRVTLLRKITREFPDLFVIMITNNDLSTDLIDAHSLKIVPFLDKPVQMRGLKELIRTRIKSCHQE